jgi:hypothetical protein
MCYYLTACGGIDDAINSWDGEINLGVALVQISEVCAHSPVFILFPDHHDIR